MLDRRADSAPEASERAWVFDAVAGISDALIIVDERARLVYRNPAAERLIGLRGLVADPLEWSKNHGLFLPDERTAFPPDEVPLFRALHNGEDVRDVGMFVRNHAVPGGIHILVSATPLRDSAGRIRGGACILRDVSVTRQQEAQLREGVRQKKAILDNLPDMAWLKDERGRYLLVNQPLATYAGRTSPDDVVGLHDDDLWPEDLATRYRADDEEVMRTRLHKRLEEPFVDATGQRLWLETFKTCIVDDEGKVIGTTGVARDITERKQIEEAMRSTNDELERRVLARTAELAEAQENLVRQERLAVLGQLAGGVAHQIRNPLAAIMNASYVLKRHLSPDQHQNVEDAIRIIHDEVRHANIIITGLLDYARVRTPDRHPASIVDLLERILDSDWIPPNVRVVRVLPTVDAVVSEVDADQLQGAIANLVRNAVDAMPDGGELSMELQLADDEIVITVSDTGVGISPQVRAHLFEPLHSTKPMGIGLGLVTARRFIEAHGGRIACVDVPSGARFQIRLPAS
ncbi:MAG: PAS domain-containing protein [Labilithrix sp.]|nr:PAS domain-containing protein [Labilithrix sp.]MCW5832265.1 PAS domain-containing protein [Labilithrix sp.]